MDTLNPFDEKIVEYVSSRGAKIGVDRETGVIRGVKILGLHSKNDRVYPGATLERAIGLYEGVRVNVNHPDGPPHAPRNYQDRLGVIRNVTRKEDGLYGDFYFNPRHLLAEQLIWDAENAPGQVGFSHNVTARTSRSKGQTVIDEIVQVRSVDLVADPATTRGLFEHQACGEHSPRAEIWDNVRHSWVPFTPLSTAKEEAMSLTLETLKQEHLELVEAIKQEALREHEQSEAVCQRAAHYAQLREENQQLKQQQQRVEWLAAVEQAIQEAHLPEMLCTETFRRQCEAAENRAVLSQLIEARQEDARLWAGSAKPVAVAQHRDRGLDSEEAFDPARFAVAIR